MDFSSSRGDVHGREAGRFSVVVVAGYDTGGGGGDGSGEGMDEKQ